MEYFLCAYVSGTPWSSAALQTEKFVGKGTHMSQTVQQWSKAYILDQGNLPLSKCSGDWTKSWINNEDLREELFTHHQSLGKYVTAMAVVDYLARSDVQHQYQLSKTISLVTAQRWMENCGFRWTTAKNGQYVDGYKHSDVVNYQQNKFLPAWYLVDPNTRKWFLRREGSTTGRCTVVWFHDESTFNAHDYWQKRWVHKDEKSKPLPKGEGLSFMIAEFESAHILFCVGKAQDGYFTNDEIIQHAKKAMMMYCLPIKCQRLARTGEADGKIVMQKVHITNGFHNGAPQEFYWPEGYENAGMFKGMVTILTKCGFNVSKLKAVSKFRVCSWGNQLMVLLYPLLSAGFHNVKSQLETTCKARGFQVIFLPKFHCELNFIEQCWGYAKRLY
ncbi:hypothetical protein DFH29DRAFT_984723 [Suillus ampliporus]|nr:hypothetical protein DFH29DRAFT_984723 [Suillus ampliporus]